jgi:dTDP-4-dehydrorhamnose 3,5-epimerase
MQLNIEGFKISGLEKKESEFSSIYKISKLGYPEHTHFQEIYCSHLYSNKVRGWYKHENSTQNVSVIKGLINFVIYDARESSSTKGSLVEVLLGKDNLYRIHLPENIWYSFGEMNGEEAYIINCLPLVYDSLKSESLPIDSNLIPFVWNKNGI